MSSLLSETDRREFYVDLDASDWTFGLRIHLRYN